MSTSTDVAEITHSARVVTSHGGAAVVHLRYDGTRPPTEVLTELRRAGWRDAVPSPPPAAAVDWSRPDPVAGTRYSLRPFQAVTDAIFTGSREERVAAVSHARDLLLRAGFDEPRRPGADDVVGRTGETAEVVDGEAPAAPLDLDGLTVGLEIVVDDSQAALVRVLVGRVGTVVDERADVRVVEVTFRGNRSENVTAVTRMTAHVPADQADALVRDLSRRAQEITRLP